MKKQPPEKRKEATQEIKDLMTINDMAAALDVDPRSIIKGCDIYLTLRAFGMFTISDPNVEKPSYRMHRKDFDLAMKALVYYEIVSVPRA